MKNIETVFITSKNSIHFDDYMNSKILEVMWFVELDNETIVWQDDGRPGTTKSAWLRLKDYLNETKLKIVKIGLKNQNYSVVIAQNKLAYFYRSMLHADIVSKDTKKLSLVGYLDESNNQNIIVEHYWHPSILIKRKEKRNINDNEKVGESLIWNI